MTQPDREWWVQLPDEHDGGAVMMQIAQPAGGLEQGQAYEVRQGITICPVCQPQHQPLEWAGSALVMGSVIVGILTVAGLVARARR